MDTQSNTELDVSTPHIYGELWTIAENSSPVKSIDLEEIVKNTSLLLHPLQESGSIRGNNLYEYFKEKKTPVLGASVWEYFKTHENQIPEEWKQSPKGNEQYIFFWGTIDRSPEGDLYVRYLSWTGGNWVFSNYLLGGNWHEDFPALVATK